MLVIFLKEVGKEVGINIGDLVLQKFNLKLRRTFMMKNLKKALKNQKGFTLIELVVVIAILAILAAIAIPRLGGFTENARQATDKEKAALVANAAATYYAQHLNDAGGPPTAAEVLQGIQDADLINADDLEMESRGYGNGTDIDVAGVGTVDHLLAVVAATDTITVTLDAVAGTGAENYTVTK